MRHGRAVTEHAALVQAQVTHVVSQQPARYRHHRRTTRLVPGSHAHTHTHTHTHMTVTCIYSVHCIQSWTQTRRKSGHWSLVTQSHRTTPPGTTRETDRKYTYYLPIVMNVSCICHAFDGVCTKFSMTHLNIIQIYPTMMIFYLDLLKITPRPAHSRGQTGSSLTTQY